MEFVSEAVEQTPEDGDRDHAAGSGLTHRGTAGPDQGRRQQAVDREMGELVETGQCRQGQGFPRLVREEKNPRHHTGRRQQGA